MFGTVCSEESDLVTWQTVSFHQHGIYLSVHLFTTVHQLSKTLSHTHISLYSLSQLSLSLNHSHSTCPRMFVAPRRLSGVAHYTSPRRPTVNHPIGHGDLAPPWLQLPGAKCRLQYIGYLARRSIISLFVTHQIEKITVIFSDVQVHRHFNSLVNSSLKRYSREP